MPDVETAEMENPDVETPGDVTDEVTEDVETPEPEVDDRHH